ncbi:MAG TPA: transcription antitermination factor NusB [Acidimicrobiales bacterium]|nr:transcription antitermination factor NusB [Acidimicrobiales bacterium]
MSPAPTARGLALRALREIDGGARANVVVPELLAGCRLDQRDRHLVTELVYGACRMQRACDWLTGRHARGRLDVEVRSALRLGAYQLGWTRIPPHAAVSATVSEVRGPGRSVVNAVLRRVATDVEKGLVSWPNAATELSYPDWVVDRLTADLGRQAALDALRTMNQPASATPRPDGYIQDPASQMIAERLLPLAAGGTVLDMCAAPGGKATGLAGGDGLVVAADLSLPRARVVASNAAHLGTETVATVVADGIDPPFRAGRFDLVLVDAPCSGLGVLRRRPDARWRVQPGDVERLAGLQRRLLLSASRLVRPGGVLAYSVCTLTAAETATMDRWLARELPGFTPLPPPQAPWANAGRGALLLPQAAGTDGMFLVVLRAPVG